MNKPLTLLLSAVVGAAAFAASAAALDDLVAEAGVDKSAEATAAEPNGEAGVLQGVAQVLSRYRSPRSYNGSCSSDGLQVSM